MNERKRINRVYSYYNEDQKFEKKWSYDNEGNRIINKERREAALQLLKSFSVSLHEKKILDVGCAGGDSIRLIKTLGGTEKNIVGIDIRKKRLNETKSFFRDATFFLMDARKLEFSDNTFDYVNLFTVLSSVLDNNNRKIISKEVMRILKPNGYVLYYDLRYNNPRNRYVKAVTKKDINKLFPSTIINMQLITLFPPLVRKIGKNVNYFYPKLSKLNFLNTHYIALLKKNYE